MKKMKNKFLIISIITIVLLCFIGCKANEEIGIDNSSNLTGDTNSNNDAKVPIVIVDDEDTSSSTQSNIDEVIDDWENIIPDVDVEVGSSSNNENSSNSSNVTTSDESQIGSNSSNVTSSKNEESDENSNEQSSDASSGDDVSKPNRPDDGYFDVAV